MLVKSIMKSKEIAEVVTIGPEATIEAAAQLLSKHGIGTVVVSSDQTTPLGILSERDIVRQLAKSGSVCLQHKVEDYMTREVVTCVQDSNAEDALAKMTEGRFRHMPVVENGVLIGIISLGDVVKAQLTEVAMEKSALEGMIMGH
ncbi:MULTISPECIES: CBS domain-containing protein [Tritonibacter]|uniref:CBS domain protein n=1 Tax=Tritonibacter scottomollicae TaxID=483013 RepID=A0A2T1AH31_TRISK|nr:CBS domain-containing protein [Tritonibacter scottomollicae]PRZ47866.1 CBS domain protein [Tritonibacter scottomollicae]WOI35219.1 CBS domain-containing protein [Tritonibacter scottomollicae]